MMTTLGTDSPKTSIVDFTQTCCMDISLLSCFLDGKGRGRGADLLCFASTLTLPVPTLRWQRRCHEADEVGIAITHSQ